MSTSLEVLLGLKRAAWRRAATRLAEAQVDHRRQESACQQARADAAALAAEVEALVRTVQGGGPALVAQLACLRLEPLGARQRDAQASVARASDRLQAAERQVEQRRGLLADCRAAQRALERRLGRQRLDRLLDRRARQDDQALESWARVRCPESGQGV